MISSSLRLGCGTLVLLERSSTSPMSVLSLVCSKFCGTVAFLASTRSVTRYSFAIGFWGSIGSADFVTLATSIECAAVTISQSSKTGSHFRRRWMENRGGDVRAGPSGLGKTNGNGAFRKVKLL